ncbi:LuxR family maltose regulon positive regulatory protein [Rhodococcus sp. AG1013]|uniref:LuxR C-terminal-related transcriptional regulator n=1 Tax=Rhodococcus sp. AG1013 TaxID=2183996 RepID=UPI000E2CFBC5|nr:LuxR C-terminal-related transcriptional regulator [Rhodococcus sp. AG1013]RDI24849.1 LuxR family maltose regulon positive regulatory protein [Rhodococcus sp. AG1013]
MTVVRGPRGAGKTAFATTWIASAQRPSGPIVMMDTPAPHTAPDDYWNTVAARVDAALESTPAAASDPVVLVLDDIDRLHDPAAELRILGLLDLDPRLHVVATTRDSCVFSDAMLDVDHVAISPTDLLFTLDESRAVLCAHGTEAAPHLLAMVQDLTGGFPPLVQAAVAVVRPFGIDFEQSRELALSALERSIDRFVDREILRDEELSELRDFMLTTSAAKTLTAEIAAMLTADHTAPDMLRELEAAGVLVRLPWPKDTEWQYPPPIRESLMRDVRNEAPEGPLRASSDLARWFLQQDDVAQALVYTVEGRDWDQAVSILKANWVVLISRHFRLVRESLAALPEHAAADDLTIRAGRELFLRFGADSAQLPDLAPPTVDVDTAARGPAIADVLAVSSVQSFILRIAGNFTQASELTVRMSELGDRALELQPDTVSAFLPLLRLQWGITQQLHGDLSRSSAELRRAYNSNRPAGTDFVARNAAGSLALNYALIGELGHAETWLERERRHEDAAAWVTAMVRVGGLVAGVLVALDRMELDVAAKILAELGDLPDDEELWAFALYAHCQLELVSGQAGAGLDRMHRASAVYERWFTPGSIAAALLTATEADLYSALGRGNEAWRTVEKTPGRGPWTSMARARMNLSSGHPAAALADCVRPTVTDCAHPRIRMESALVQAAAHLELSHEPQAQAMLQRAVALFDQTGLVRPFASLPVGRIAQMSTLGVALPEKWLAAVPPPESGVFPDRIRLVDLSDRESAVLNVLASTSSVAEIATTLFVSQNTVKTQLRSVYRKLGVHSRADALLTAARLGLIGPPPGTAG